MAPKSNADLEEIWERIMHLEAEVRALRAVLVWDIVNTDAALRGHMDGIAREIERIIAGPSTSPSSNLERAQLLRLMAALGRRGQCAPDGPP